jgi:hypothetical protein
LKVARMSTPSVPTNDVASVAPAPGIVVKVKAFGE